MGERRRIRFKEKKRKKKDEEELFSNIYIYPRFQCFSKNRGIKDTVIPFSIFFVNLRMKRRKENLRLFTFFTSARRLSHLSLSMCTRLSSFSLRSLFPWRKIYRADTVIPVAYLNNDIFFSSLFPFNGDAFVTVYHSFFCILIRLVSIRFMRNDARRRP